MVLWCNAVDLAAALPATVHYNSLYNHHTEKVHFISTQPPLNTPEHLNLLQSYQVTAGQHLSNDLLLIFLRDRNLI